MENKKNLSIIELLIIFILLLVSNVSAFFRVLWLIPDVVLVQMIIFVLITGIAIWYLVKENLFEPFLAKIKKNWFLFPFLIFSFFSIFWSIQPQSSLVRWIIFLSTILLGAYFGLKKSFYETIKIVSVFCIMILLLSYYFIAFYPELGKMHYSPYEGTWQGIFWHKNHFGQILVLMSFFFLSLTIETRKSKSIEKYIWGFSFLLSIFALYKTQSAGAYLTAIAVYGAYILLVIWNKIKSKLTTKHYVIFFILMIICAIILFSNLSTLFGIFGRSPSLTGRIPMWENLYEKYFLKHPIIGYGFNAFWYYYPHRANMQSLTGWGNPPVISDNGFFDIIINTGIIGFLLFCIFYFVLWYRAAKILINAEHTFDLVPIIFMIFILVANISFSLLFETEAFIMLLMMILLFSNPQLKSSNLLTNDN